MVAQAFRIRKLEAQDAHMSFTVACEPKGPTPTGPQDTGSFFRLLVCCPGIVGRVYSSCNSWSGFGHPEAPSCFTRMIQGTPACTPLAPCMYMSVSDPCEPYGRPVELSCHSGAGWLSAAIHCSIYHFWERRVTISGVLFYRQDPWNARA